MDTAETYECTRLFLLLSFPRIVIAVFENSAICGIFCIALAVASATSRLDELSFET